MTYSVLIILIFPLFPFKFLFFFLKKPSKSNLCYSNTLRCLHTLKITDTHSSKSYELLIDLQLGVGFLALPTPYWILSN